MTKTHKIILFGFALCIAGAVCAECGIYVVAWTLGCLGFMTFAIGPLTEDL